MLSDFLYVFEFKSSIFFSFRMLQGGNASVYWKLKKWRNVTMIVGQYIIVLGKKEVRRRIVIAFHRVVMNKLRCEYDWISLIWKDWERKREIFHVLLFSPIWFDEVKFIEMRGWEHNAKTSKVIDERKKITEKNIHYYIYTCKLTVYCWRKENERRIQRLW